MSTKKKLYKSKEERLHEEKVHAHNLHTNTVGRMVMGFDDIYTADGCRVDPGGTCPHGYRSPLVVLGIH